MPNALVVADDLTGTLDTGHGFAARGRAVHAHLAAVDAADAGGDETPGDVDVLAVDTDSRDVGADAAARAVGAVVASADAPLVYEKIDSTLRGNVVAAVDAALEASGAAVAVVAPAFPSTGRTTRDGIHRVEGTPLADAGYGVDESTLPRFFAASDYPVEHLSLSVVDGGADEVADALRERVDATDASPVVVTCDAVADAHLAAVADGADALATETLFVGSGGLAEHVTVPGKSTAPAPPSREGAGVLGVVGSVNPRTLEQLAAVPSEDVVRADPVTAVWNPAAAASAVVPRLVERFEERGRAVVTAAVEQSDVERAEAAAAEVSAGTGRDTDAGDRIARALATTAARTVTENEAIEPAKLVLTGGDIARGTLDELAVTGIGLTGRAVADGIPEGWIADGPAAGTRIVTKAGGFGDRRTIVNSIQPKGNSHD